MELLKKIYYEPTTGFQSKERLYKKAKLVDPKIKFQDVSEFYQNQATAQITQSVKRNKKYNSVISNGLRSNYQMDIMYLPNPTQNKGFKYLLTCIDVYSRFVFALPMKAKSGEVVFETFKKLIENFGKPINLNLDLGTEFTFSPFKTYCENQGIQLWYSNTEQENKNAVIERFHRTLRNLILKYEVAYGKAYIEDLQKLIENYNSTIHSTTKQKPVDVWNGDKTNQQKIVILPNPFVVGDRVRHLVKKRTFDKASDTTTFTRTIYTITKIEGNAIYLNDLKKPFRVFELEHAVKEGIKENNEGYEEEKEKQKMKEARERRMRREGLY